MAHSLSTGIMRSLQRDTSIIVAMEVSLWRDLSAVDSKGIMLGGGSFSLFNSAMRVLPAAV